MLTRNKYLTDDELKLQKKQLGSDRDGLLIRLALATGARANELLQVKKADFSDGVLLIHGSKGSNAREIPLPADLYAELMSMPVIGNAPLFPFKYRRLEQIWRYHRVCDKTFHALRHTFAVNLYRSTRDIRLVQVALGHKSINNTLIYAAVVDAGEKLKLALVG